MYYIIHTIYNMYTKAFLLCLIKARERTFEKKEKEKLGNKLNKMGTLNMEQKK